MSATAYKGAKEGMGSGGDPRISYARKRAEMRRLARERSASRAVSEISENDRRYDPLKRKQSPRWLGTGKGLLYLVVAVGLHASALAGFFWFPSSNENQLPAIKNTTEKVTFKIKEKVMPPPAPTVPPNNIEPEIRVPVKPEPTPKTESVKKRPKRFAKAGKRKNNTPLDNQIQADPVDLDNTPAPQTEPRRRVVGLSFESTVQGGTGPSFAVGNTRMGQTDTRAEDPNSIGKLAPEKIRVGNPEDVGTNRVASYIPTSKVKLTRPKRISEVDLRYPRQLKDQGVEGNVVVLIRIAANGSVSRVKILKSSGYPEFDDAAKQTASKERFAPATRDGEPIDYNLKYTYRFRIKQA